MSEVVISLEVESLAEGGFVATSPDVPGLVAQGKTLTETCDIAREVALAIAEVHRENGQPLPPALQEITNAEHPQPFRMHVPISVP